MAEITNTPIRALTERKEVDNMFMTRYVLSDGTIQIDISRRSYVGEPDVRVLQSSDGSVLTREGGRLHCGGNLLAEFAFSTFLK